MYKDLSIYIHIPFCVKKCNYCDFVSAAPGPGQLKAYIGALCKEIELSAFYADNFNIKTVFIGGGTPSIYDPSDIIVILNTLQNTFEKRRKGSYIPKEITIECNPGTLNEHKLMEYRKAGINRLSIGLQSGNDKELAMLGRIHTLNDWENSMVLARKYGFNNINVDIISGIPGQKAETFEKTLQKVLEYMPENISAYSLIIEEGTPFYEKYNPSVLTAEELDRWECEDRRIYDLTYDILSEHGYNRYEISNYSKCGYECRHNMVYWKRGDYLGYGPSAASLIDNVRFSNTDSICEYIEFNGKCVKDKEILDINDIMSEFVFLGLRLSCGISVNEFFENFGKSIYEVYGDVIEKWKKRDMLIEKEGRIFCSYEGFNVCNMIMSDFIL